MKKWLLSTVAIMMMAFVCNAAPIDGKWKTSFEGQDGNMEIVFTFKVDGNVLTGSIATPMGDMPISNGKIEGNEFTFDVDMNGNPIPHKGKVEGDTITLKITAENSPVPGNGEMILKKVVE